MNFNIHSGSGPNPNAPDYQILILNKIFLIIVFFAILLRVYLSLTTTYIWDEEKDWIPAALSISFDPESLNLPIRAKYHGALSAYFIKAGSLLFGENPFGFRIMNILFGIGTIVVVALIVRIWAGTTAALWTAAFLSFNEFHVAFSTIAFQQSSFFLFSSLAILSFVLFLAREDPRWLYGAAVFTGIGFLCYEIASLLVPVFFMTLLLSGHRKWLLKFHPYAALALLVLIISPDVYTNYANKPEHGASYEDHLSRFSGVGFSKYYIMFFFRNAMIDVYNFFGKTLYFQGTDYPAMNSIFGLILFSIIIFYSVMFFCNKSYRNNAFLLFMLCSFWLVFIFFSMLSPGYNPGGLSAQLWIWVGLIIVPSVILAGIFISGLDGRLRQLAVAISCVAMAYSAFNVLYSRLGMASHQVAFVPEFISPSAGDMADVQARINFCVLCDRDAEIALVGVGILQNDKKSHKSAFDTGDVEGAERGTKDLNFRLRPVIDPDGKLWVGRIYHISYRIPDFIGHPKIRVGTVRVPRNPSQNYGNVFWTR